MKVWYDITNTPQVHFLLAVEDIIKDIDSSCVSVYTAREFSETAKMLAQRVGENKFISIGGHYGKSYLKKALGLLLRFQKVKETRIIYDISISCGSENAVWKAKMEHKKSIAFGDNDQARQWTYGHFVDYAFFPNAISRTVLERQGLKHKLYLYNGYKEDLYLANYIPNSSFLSSLPFDKYVLVRPENVMANYIRNGEVKSITPDLLKKLSDAGNNIVYLPRYESDRKYASKVNNVFIPEHPINGLDACYYADAVLTGAGTFAREAACLGVPSFSFYAGKELLSVDKKMIAEEKMYFSRNVDQLMEQYLKSKKQMPDIQRCKDVRQEVRDKLYEVIETFNIMQ